MKIKAYAKVNLALKVINKREDGYHNLSTIMDLIDLYDVIYISKCKEIKFSCNDKSLENDNNLILKAIKAVKEAYPSVSTNGVYIKLIKNIPYGAGLGGGSSDAASVILALNKIWKLRLSFDELVQVALRVGSDVPFFLLKGLGILSGIGESVNCIDSETKLYYLLVLPGYHTSTKNVYEANKINSNDYTNIDNMIRGFHFDDKNMIIDNMVNDLEEATISINSQEPKIVDIINDLNDLIQEKCIHAKAIMSGSGSTVFAAFKELKDAEAIKDALNYHNYNVIITSSKRNA